MSLFDSPAFENHEGVHAFCDPEHGLKAIIAIHSTAQGSGRRWLPHVGLSR